MISLVLLSVVASALLGEAGASPEPSFASASFFKGVALHPACKAGTFGSLRRTQDFEETCDVLGGVVGSDGNCKICESPGSANCVAFTPDGELLFDTCVTEDGEEVCASLECSGDGASAEWCGCFKTGGDKLCVVIGVEGEKETCKKITWNGEDCPGGCAIDASGEPVFDCSAVGGPSSEGGTMSTAAVAFPATAISSTSLGLVFGILLV